MGLFVRNAGGRSGSARGGKEGRRRDKSEGRRGPRVTFYSWSVSVRLKLLYMSICNKYACAVTQKQ